ncbi:putative E2 ubiquitin-conjugating enzyme [Mycosarcoma maydis]|uniref:E2 ubiquitin-conjugating enzyme n=1 Tax=Mycosarcoma maydis TaxID=5270 RepID=A0A0D1DP39_MYCMD|nr:putative E2 ubiquitin-conjugating enzyme [Ustilago maydis 521]KIS66219.1 putative E2 ubiquitin-conjugating enzyme [Ustilago maydis 521]|eukprot:XP_011392301.1 putative E2 ubiquitin-conjugating enzyme [Ustilago maydis 521]
MATATSHNKKSSAVKRILSEARELGCDSSDLYTAAPLEDNIFEWHFTLRGPANTEFADGLYHGRILLPAEYPMRPPNLMLLTPNGRWELNKKICLTFTGFHEEMWQPAWGIRTALLGLQTFMTAKAEAAVGIGSLDYPVEARKRMASESRRWRCDICEKSTLEMLPDADEQGREKRQEALPEGLQVQLNAPSHKPSSASSDTTQSDPIPTRASSDQACEPTMSTAAPTAAAPTSQLHYRPPATTAAPTPTTSSTSSAAPTPSVIRVSAIEQKLSVIDNCIKALGILVALLIVKRLI